MIMKKWWILKGIKFIAFVALMILALGFVTMTLWNWLIPTLFNGPSILFEQALGLLLLSKILFGFGQGGWHGKKEHFREHWRARWEEKLATMTPEEREKAKAAFDRCGYSRWHKPDESRTA
jgi:hypothetical protein